MSKKGFLFGALSSGIVIFILGFVSAGFLLTAEFQAVFAAVDLEAQGPSIFIVHTVIRFLSGFAAFSIFALCAKALPGNKALLGATALVWVLLYLPAVMLFSDLGLLGLSGNIKIGAYGALEIALAILAGRFVARKF